MQIVAIDTSLAQHLPNDPHTIAKLGETPLPDKTYLWVSLSREEFVAHVAVIQGLLLRLTGWQLIDIHVTDLSNEFSSSRFDYTSQYDVLTFHQLNKKRKSTKAINEHFSEEGDILERVETEPVSFVVFDKLLLSMHPQHCEVRQNATDRLMRLSANDKTLSVSMPANPADLMLRKVNLMIDDFLALRRGLSRQLDTWQAILLNPKSQFHNWFALLGARRTLHYLDDICEEQASAIRDWIDSLKALPAAETPWLQHERDMISVRSRDVLEHIERVVHHVERLEQSVETAVQIHFNAQSNRTNDIIRTFTALTAIFLPLNLVASIFGMNFEFMPALHKESGFWVMISAMLGIPIVLTVFFWYKRIWHFKIPGFKKKPTQRKS